MSTLYGDTRIEMLIDPTHFDIVIAAAIFQLRDNPEDTKLREALEHLANANNYRTLEEYEQELLS